MTQRFTKFFIAFISVCALYAGTEAKVITIKTEKLEECVGISTFLTNTKGEIFLFSPRTFKIFKFDQEGNFLKSFCNQGVGPGEIKRVRSIYHNPVNDYLYLPEYYSSIKRISMFDSDGKFQNYMDIDLAINQKDKVRRLLFLNDGSFYCLIEEMVGSIRHGGVFLTKDKLTMFYFDKSGKKKSTAFTTFYSSEMSSGPGWGGPGILFNPSHIFKNSLDGNILFGKTDENIISVFNKSGKKIGSIPLPIKRIKLNNDEFEKAKNELLKNFASDLRMQDLAKKMIKLEYKPIYATFFVSPKYLIVTRYQTTEYFDAISHTELLFLDHKGKLLSSKTIKGEVINIKDNLAFIVNYDADDNESFRIEELNPIPKTKDQKI